MALRFQNNYDFTDVPIPTTKQPPRTGATVRRAKTLTRPERSVAPVPLINPPNAHSAPTGKTASPDEYNGSTTWRIFSLIVTFWAPNILLSSLGGIKEPQMRQAWREKVALCFIIALLCGCVGFATVGFQKVLCPEQNATDERYVRQSSGVGTRGENTLGYAGAIYNITPGRTAPGNVNLAALAAASSSQDITPLFQREANLYAACAGVNFRIAQDQPCSERTPCPLPRPTESAFATLGLVPTDLLVGYSWEQITEQPNYIVVDGTVLNLTPYLTTHPAPIPGDKMDTAIRTVMALPDHGKDATYLFVGRPDLRAAVPCLKQRYIAGNIDKVTPGCFVSTLFLYAGLFVILALVLVRFAMACVFNWFLSEKLAGPPTAQELNRSAISPAVLPEGANISVDNKNGTAPWAHPNKKLVKGQKGGRSVASSASSTTLSNPEPIMSLQQIGAELFAVCLVTAYSEGEESLRTTLDSISNTTYSDARKLLFVVADGMITGAGEKQSTPDICVGLLEADPRFGNPMPMSYEAVGSGAKACNRAMVYAGHYTVSGRRTPTVIVVKCGTEKEAMTDKKPGNRGKRDSQLILMNFFSRVTYNDRMCPLDFDLFRKIHTLMGITPDFFEVCLMVDADTKVFPSSLGHLVNCMHHDQMIMGVCGETRIANKRQSWVTTIQVFEYFISHHLAKAFESVFGGVSCLPGCFSMFRLKSRKTSGDDWVPLIIKPEIVKEYSQSEVTTLHQKNLLLLGEDRFLTTILIRTFPNRKMMFLPQARCRTIVPDTFSMLLSQRRRWINSTIHNLMELVLVRNLCGTFCFSMQFVVFMDLLGTVVLPIAIALTYALIIGIALDPPKTFEQAIPIMLLGAVLGLPAVLILITTRKVIYVFWMLIYLLALPVWNFILPLYAFWHFDDFSWGETRKVEGEGKGEGHDMGGGVKGPAVPLRRWEDWERSRLRKIKRDERRRKDLERYNPTFGNGEREFLQAPDTRSQYDSDTYSMASSDDDHWGAQIGGYNENNAQYPPPPVALFTPGQDQLQNAQTVDGNALEAMLEQGYDDSPAPSPRSGSPRQRFQLQDSNSTMQLPAMNSSGYSPLSRSGSPGVSPQVQSPPMTFRGAQEKYGPLGPLDPSAKF